MANPQVSRKRGKFSIPPLYLPKVVSTTPVRKAALTVVGAAGRDPTARVLLASVQFVDRIVTASATNEAGRVVMVLVVPRFAEFVWL